MRLPPFILHPSPFTLPTLLLLSLFTLHPSPLSATPLTTLDHTPTTLSAHLQPPATLVLIATESSDLPEAQRLLTLAASQDHPALILLQLPESPIQAAALRRAARQYFKSEYSQTHVYYLQTSDHPHPPSKTLLLAPDHPTPLHQSQTYPPDLPTSSHQTALLKSSSERH